MYTGCVCPVPGNDRRQILIVPFRDSDVRSTSSYFKLSHFHVHVVHSLSIFAIHIFYYYWTRLFWLLISFFIIFISWSFGRSVLISQMIHILMKNELWIFFSLPFSAKMPPLLFNKGRRHNEFYTHCLCYFAKRFLKKKRKENNKNAVCGFSLFDILYNFWFDFFFQINTVCVF